MAEAIIPRRTINKQEYVLLADITVGTATTSVDITGLNIGKEEEIVLMADFKNTSANGTVYLLFANGNNSTTQYYRQYIGADNSAISSSRSNEAIYSYAVNGQETISFSNLKLTNNGYFVWQSDNTWNIGVSSMLYYQVYGTSTFTMSSITSLRISGGTNSIGAGSRFQLYKVGA